MAAPTALEMVAQARAALRRTRTLEIRLDYLKDYSERHRFIRLLSTLKPRPCIIATLRTKAGGGQLDVRSHSGIHKLKLTLVEAAKRGCSWCDMETEAIGHSLSWLRSEFDALRGKIISSLHDFEETPSDLSGVRDMVERFPGEPVKAATYCNSNADSLRLLALCKGRRDVIAVPMGEMGLPARVLALAHGSALAYAAVGEKTAPGQLTLDEMKNLYRADKLDKRSRVYGVIGNPVSHSLSPLLHNTGFIARRMNDVYLPFLVNDLRDFLGAIGPLGIRGFSVTIPFKEKILRHLDDCDPLAAAIGAVNTVTVRGSGKLYGMNTDYVGVLRTLQKRVRLRGSRVLVYGAGGVARAVAFALAQEGAIPAICARRREPARKLARAVHGEALERRQLKNEFFDATVNCTSVGMYPHAGESPLRARELNCRLVFDTVYRPMKTRLLQLAERRGIETVSGVEMFLAQGMAQWEIWTEQRAPEAPMRRAVMDALRRKARVQH